MKKGWKYKKLGEVFSSINNGANIKQIKGANGIPITRIETLSNDKFNRDRMGYANIGDITPYASYILNEGDILMSHINSMKFLGRSVAYSKKGDETIIHGMNLLRLVPTMNVLSSFMIYQFQTSFFKDQILQISHQSVNQASFNISNLKGLNIMVPPLEQQQRIVDYLNAAFAQIDELKNNAERQLAEARALFHSALTQAMQPKPGWQEYKIMEIGDVIGGTTPSTSNPNYWGGDKCWISPAELHGEKYLYDSVKKITEEAVIAKNLKLLPEGTVILSSRAPIGKVAINKVPMYCNQGFKCIVCGPRIFNEFLYWWLWGNTDYLNSIGTGATFAEISKTVVQNIIIRIPSKPEQEKIAARLDGYYSFVHRLEHIQNEIITECDALKQALLRQIFE